jgi:hypothetical protein
VNDDVIASNINSVEFNSEFKAVDKDVESSLDDNYLKRFVETAHSACCSFEDHYF